MKILKKYFLPIWGSILGILAFGVPALLVPLNPPPNEQTLVSFPAKILRVQERQPNLTLLVDGKEINARFPLSLYELFSSSSRYPWLSDSQVEALKGCDAQIYGADFRYVWPRAFRVWKITCSGKTVVGFDEVVKNFYKMTAIGGPPQFIGSLAIFFLVVLTFVKARRRG